MGFYFPLSSVLRVREAAEQREERALQDITSDIDSATQSLEEVKRVLSEMEKTRQEIPESLQSGYNVQAWYGQREILTESKRQLLERIDKLKVLRGQQMMAYRNARQHREVLDNLRERVFVEFEADLDRRDQRAMDDQHNAQRIRKQSS